DESRTLLQPLSRPVAAEHLNRWPCHINVIVAFGPVQMQVAARQVGSDLAAGTSSEYTSDGDGTGAGSAGQRLAGAALPNAHGHIIGPIHADEFDVGSSRKRRVGFQPRTSAMNL